MTEPNEPEIKNDEEISDLAAAVFELIDANKMFETATIDLIEKLMREYQTRGLGAISMAHNDLVVMRYERAILNDLVRFGMGAIRAAQAVITVGTIIRVNNKVLEISKSAPHQGMSLEALRHIYRKTFFKADEVYDDLRKLTGTIFAELDNDGIDELTLYS